MKGPPPNPLAHWSDRERSGCDSRPDDQNPTIHTFVHASKSEQLRRALPVLLEARRSVVLGGHRDVIDAIQSAGKSGIACHWARELLQSVVSDISLIAWQSNLANRQSDITRALDRAISLARKPDRRCGNWHISEVRS